LTRLRRTRRTLPPHCDEVVSLGNREGPAALNPPKESSTSGLARAFRSAARAGAEPRGIFRTRTPDFIPDDAVELAGPHPDAAAVQRGVRSAVDDAAAIGQDLDPVAVPPDARIGVEI